MGGMGGGNEQLLFCTAVSSLATIASNSLSLLDLSASEHKLKIVITHQMYYCVSLVHLPAACSLTTSASRYSKRLELLSTVKFSSRLPVKSMIEVDH